MKQGENYNTVAKLATPTELQGWGLSGNERCELIHDWETRPNALEGERDTYVEEWNVYGPAGDVIGCIYDRGDGYRYAADRCAGELDY